MHDSDSRVYILDRLLEQDYIDGAIAIFAARLTPNGEVTMGGIHGTSKNILPELAALVRKHNKPLFLCLMAAAEALLSARRMVEYPIFADSEKAVDAAAILRDYSMRGRGGEGRA